MAEPTFGGTTTVGAVTGGTIGLVVAGPPGAIVGAKIGAGVGWAASWAVAAVVAKKVTEKKKS